MTVYDRVKFIADKKKISIKSIETSCGLANGSIKKWSTSFPRADALYKVASFLGEPIEFFLSSMKMSSFLVENIAECDLTEQEQMLVKMFRETTAEGRFEMIAAIMGIKNDIE